VTTPYRDAAPSVAVDSRPTDMQPSRETLTERDLLELATSCAIEQHVTLTEMFSRSRLAPIVRARRSFFVALRDMGWSFPAIGRLVGMDHTTIIHNVYHPSVVDAPRPPKVRVA
jgi:chromosomal replication initiation ATPase DnaA